MTNKYLEKIAGIAGLLSAAPKAAGRTIQAVKGADNVFKASTPMRDAVGFMKVNKKPLVIGAGLGLAGGMAAGSAMDGQEKQANHEGNKMTNKYLEKIAADYIAKGLVSPAWQEQSIAKEHGKKGPSAGELLSKHVGGTTRAGLRGYAEGAAGGVGGLVAGSAANALASKVLGKSVAGGGRIGAALGGLAGLVHGNYASLKNQAAEAHKKYKEKQAAENWIQGAIKHPGALHKALGVPADEKIPAAKLEAAAKKGGKIGREARLAETLKGLRHGKK